ncbi:hypothetical protein HDG32_005520 [Paraburkholderia sp. CI2]|uniref:hypothetical protein n=1 Tax=Paraburkholderia sp. CI2 TaxID=2723093 RepID=UPI00161DF91C|nr:hypothetical protein [Paraburkholderia sp. CI2]MBB5469373.1 hypothetical protein [Paraburkholderia sp. CI2]
MTRLVYAVAAHLHMTAGEVETRMDSHELFTWASLLFGFGSDPVSENVVTLSVEDEIAAWGK